MEVGLGRSPKIPHSSLSHHCRPIPGCQGTSPLFLSISGGRASFPSPCSSWSSQDRREEIAGTESSDAGQGWSYTGLLDTKSRDQTRRLPVTEGG